MGELSEKGDRQGYKEGLWTGTYIKPCKADFVQLSPILTDQKCENKLSDLVQANTMVGHSLSKYDASLRETFIFTENQSTLHKWRSQESMLIFWFDSQILYTLH